MNPISLLLEASVVTPQTVLFEGKAHSVILPGEMGVFEVVTGHKPLLSRLIFGDVIIDDHPIPIRRGVVKVMLNRVLAIVEEGRS